MKIEISIEKFEELIKKGYSLDIVFLLNIVDQLETLDESPKIQLLKQTLLRKGLVSEENKLTLEGNELLQFISSPNKEKIVRKKPDEDKFLEWWNTYRSTDTIFLSDKTKNINDKKVLFPGTRALRVKKDDCKAKIHKILNEGEYAIEDLVRALNYEIQLKIQKSLKDNKNYLSYMQNSLTYLNQRTYESFIEVSKSQKEEKVWTGAVDI